MADLLLRNGEVVAGGEVRRADVYIRDGKIAAIGSQLPIAAEYEVDIRGLHLLPGIIDTHVHFRDPGFEQFEDFATGTAAAAHGGVTTVIDMPNTDPFVRDAAAVRSKVERITPKAHVDFGLWGCAIPDNLEELEGLAEEGVLAYKAFMGESVRTPILEDGLLMRALGIIAEIGLPMGVHAENGSIVRVETERVKAAGRTDGLAHLHGRPNVAEAEAVSRAVLFARYTGARVHICHMSTAEAVEIVARAKEDGVRVTAETCPQYLLLTDEDVREKGGWLKVNPPVRTAKDVRALWQAIRDGTVDAIATDHGPRLEHEKRADSIWDAVSGLHGIETNVVLMLTAVANGELSLVEYVSVACERAARAFGIYPRKGTIQIGSDADLTAVDLSASGTIHGADLHTKVKISPFEGAQVKAQVVHTLVRGGFVIRNRELVGKPRGEYVRVGEAS